MTIMENKHKPSTPDVFESNTNTSKGKGRKYKGWQRRKYDYRKSWSIYQYNIFTIDPTRMNKKFLTSREVLLEYATENFGAGMKWPLAK